VTRQQLMQMLQSLLEDAFKVVIQRRTRDGGILALRQTTRGKLGPNITAATPADARLNPVGAQPICRHCQLLSSSSSDCG